MTERECKANLRGRTPVILDNKKIKVDITKHYDHGTFIEYITFYYTINNVNYKKKDKYSNCLKAFDISYHIILKNCIKSPNYIVENAKKLEEKVVSMV